jgi:hypothetical protein
MAPLFSLWSRDRLRPEDPPLIEQLWTLWGGKAEDVMLFLLTNLIDIHFTLITKLGLQFEFNAQNVLLGLDAQCNIESIVLRDMMDIEKDLVIRRSLGLHTDFASHPYHVLGVEDQDFARQRRSFSFDFKLATYVIEPLVRCFRLSSDRIVKEILGVLRNHTHKWIAHLPSAYFPPDDTWYSYAKVLVDREKILIQNRRPALR